MNDLLALMDRHAVLCNMLAVACVLVVLYLDQPIGEMP